jgi:predicted nucleotide-binding protein
MNLLANTNRDDGLGTLLVPLEQAKQLIADRIKIGKDFARSSPSSATDVAVLRAEFAKWDGYNGVLLGRIATGAVFPLFYDLRKVDALPHDVNWRIARGEVIQNLQYRCISLEVILELLPLLALSQAHIPVGLTQPSSPQTNHIFIVHGHDDTLKEQVARTLEKLGLEPIILHEQPNRGKTIIEKFEKHADVGFAVVLLTPDDVGGKKPSTGNPTLSDRARQNVIFELGYFARGLGRDRVVALRKGETELPSDLHGVVYQDVDSGGAWKLKLADELKAAGYSVDKNKL